METNLFVGDVFFRLSYPCFQQSRPLLEGFCLRALSKKEHNGETWTPLRLEQSSTNEVIAKLLFCLSPNMSSEATENMSSSAMIL